MTEKKTKASGLADIWGDTVNLKHLGCAMIIGVTLGFLFFWSGLQAIKSLYPDIQGSLQQAIALLVGIVGCLLAAVISAKLFPPKRLLSEQTFSEADRARVLQELQINVEEEAEHMKTLPADILVEMRELKIDDIFDAPKSKEKEA